MSQDEILASLPPAIAAKSISSREIVLPLKEALSAIDILEKLNLHIVGWEGWVRDTCGNVGHGNAPQGVYGLEHKTLKYAADFCRKTIPADAETWELEHGDSDRKLFFCITVGKMR